MSHSSLRAGAVQYKITALKSWMDFAKKIEKIVSAAAQQRVGLLLFPEYLSIHLTQLKKGKGPDLPFLQPFAHPYLELFKGLSQRYQMTILAGTFPLYGQTQYVNRAHLCYPNGTLAYQDKLNLIPSESQTEIKKGENGIHVFECPSGNQLSINVCYDIEFPLLAKEAVKKGAKLILVPSCTQTLAGYYRVALTARARAIENQCFVIQSPIIGSLCLDDEPFQNFGRAGIYSPCDGGFPASGILAEGRLNQPELVVADLNFNELQRVRQHGSVLNYQDNTLS